MFRFYDPTAGAVKIDGHDLRSLSLSDLREHMALVSQEVVLFDLTVAENIALGKPGATRGEIEAAAQAAFADEFIRKVPQGFDTPVGERGVTLSGGQRQRVAIARALVNNPSILLADEPTGALDTKTSYEIMELFERLYEAGNTIIVVTHEHDIAERAHRVITIRDGKIESDEKIK
jgi:ABC-type multidrug transport system fused ATPase/permease subunit